MSLDKRDNRFFYGAAIITSFIGMVLLLATDSAGFDASNYYLGVYVYGGFGAFSGILGVPIILSAVGLLYATGISILAIGYPEKIQNKKFKELGLLLSIVVFFVSIIGLAVFSIEMETENAWWWPDVGFFGGVISGFLTSIFLFLALKDIMNKKFKKLVLILVIVLIIVAIIGFSVSSD